MPRNSQRIAPVQPGRPAIQCEAVEDQNTRIAQMVLERLFNGTPGEVIEIFHGLPVVVSAAVAVRVVYELDAGQARQFLALLEEFS